MARKSKLEKEVAEGLAGALKEGWVELVGKDRFRLTEKGIAHMEKAFPRSIARSNAGGAMGLREWMASCEEENMERQLAEAVASGELRTFIDTRDGIRKWVNAKAPKQAGEVA